MAIPDFKFYYRTKVIKPTWYWQKTDRWINVIELKTKMQIHLPVDTWFRQKPKYYNGKNKPSSICGAGLTICQHIKEFKEINVYHNVQNSVPSGSITST